MQSQTAQPTKELIDSLLTNHKTRVAVTRASHLMFCATYFAHYTQFPFADFHREMFALSERDDIPLFIVEAFRGSGKSTIMTMSLPIWSVLGKDQRKFIMLLGQTQRQAKQHFMNLKRELETNELLRNDLGPFETVEDEWGSNSIVLTRYGARITCASMEQPIRGMRHGRHRPDLVICDDVEDVSSAKTKEGRDKAYQWFTSEVLPIGDERTKIVVVGNLVHEDGLLSRLENAITNKERKGVFKKYPFLDGKDKPLWKSRFPTKEDVQKKIAFVGDLITWAREYMLYIISDVERVIHREWLHYYDELPGVNGDNFKFGVIGVDLAISQRSRADYTAIVTAMVYKNGDSRKIYILPSPINARLTFPRAVEKIKDTHDASPRPKKTKIAVESVAYQAAMWQELKRQGYEAEPYEVRGSDKRSRLALLSEPIKNGTILFPKHGAKDLINQLVNFGVERHDDLADAFAITASYGMEKKIKTFGVWVIDTRPEPRYSLGDVFGGGYWNQPGNFRR